MASQRKLSAANKEGEEHRFNHKIMVQIQRRSLEDDAQLWDQKVKVKVASSEGKGGNWPIHVNLNGKSFLIPRNVVVEIPYPVYMHLTEGCIETRFEPQYDNKGDLDMQRKDMPRFHITPVGFVPQPQQPAEMGG